MKQWLARFSQTLLLMFCMVPDPVFSSENPLCDNLLLLDRLPGHAQRLLDPRSSTSARSTYLTDIERASVWPGPGASGALPSEFMATMDQAIGLHRRFLDLIDAGSVAMGRDLIASRDWRRLDALVDEQLHLHRCSGTRAGTRPDTISTVGSMPTLSAAMPARPLGQAGSAAYQLKILAIPTWGLLALVLTIGVALAGVCLFLSRREAPRFSCFITGAMQGHLYCEATQIYDMSRTGCKLRLYDGFAPKRPLTLFFGHWAIPAKAVWSNRHYAGLRFEQRLTPVQLRDILDQGDRSIDSNGPAVPSLPCHDGACREICPKYKMMQDERAGIRDAGIIRIDLTNGPDRPGALE